MDKGPPDCEWEEIENIGDVLGWILHHQTNPQPFADFRRQLRAEFNGLLVEGGFVAVIMYVSERDFDTAETYPGINLVRIEVRLNQNDIKPTKSAQWAFAMDQYGRHGNIILCTYITDDQFIKLRAGPVSKK